MLRRIALGGVALVVALAFFIAMQPADFAIVRSATIQAPAEAIYPRIQDLRAMNEWSPFAKMDPALKITYDGPAAGVGASSAWEGPEAGKGRQTITAVKPNQEVEIRLDFLEPVEATNRAVFTLTPAAGGGTTVGWRMEGERGFAGKAFAVLSGMDGAIGEEFEKGLAALKALAEAKRQEAGAPVPGD